ncbi:DUF4262 domain-containing protein [Streptomyces sp. NPDC058268]|uniref:DUF4262 domain-containing protein n=1 Tax=Streptomyces sp. NPDC058268 TaxID=3346413 RepID=UPI0036E33172
MDHTPASMATRIIMDAGYVVQWTHDQDGVPLAYTAGLCDRPGRAYELALTGQSMSTSGAVLNRAVAQLVLDAIDPAEGLVLNEVLNGYAVRLRRVVDTVQFVAMRALYGFQPAVWQVLLPDVNGAFPGQDGYRTGLVQPTP